MENSNQNPMQKGNSYKKMAVMLVVSFIVMYAVMFLNVNDTSHIYLSITRLYMALIMVAPMALLMLGLMGQMYKNKRLNGIITVSAIVVFVAALAMLRAQVFINDVQYMKVMIPHHSSAILTSENANIEDPEVKGLSEQIIESQKEEIAQMKAILERME